MAIIFSYLNCGEENIATYIKRNIKIYLSHYESVEIELTPVSQKNLISCNPLDCFVSYFSFIKNFWFQIFSKNEIEILLVQLLRQKTVAESISLFLVEL